MKRFLLGTLMVLSWTTSVCSGGEDLGVRIEKSLAVHRDFPSPGIEFRDITPIFRDPQLFSDIISALTSHYKGKDIDVIACIESRGFLLGPSLALALGKPFVLIRKKGKLPGGLYEASYKKLYGHDSLVLTKDALLAGQKVLLVDDFYTTGGTLKAAQSLVEQAGAVVSEAAVLIDMADAKEKHKPLFPVHSLTQLRFFGGKP